MSRGQVQTDLRQKLPDPPSDLQEAQPQGIELHPPRPACHELPPQGVHQPVGTSVQQKPELVGDEPVAAEAIRFRVQLEVLDPVLALSSTGVEPVEVLRPVGPRGYQEAGVGPLLHGLRLVDYPASVLPAPSSVGPLGEELDL